METGLKYRAFISYSHRDKAWGDWLHKVLESYRVPKRVVGTAGRDGLVPTRLFPIFRDREEMASSSDLNEQIKIALEQSAWLIVICSPYGATSRWVNEEILTFKRLGRANRILALIVDGEPNAADKSVPHGGDPAAECFPPALKFNLGADGELSSERTEPVAADARPQADGKESAKLKLIAGLLGVGYDALKQRDLEAARRRARLFQAVAASMALLALIATVAAWFAFKQRQEARFQRDQVVQAQMRLLTQNAAERLRGGDVAEAQQLVLEVLARRNDSKADRAAAASVFQEIRAADRQLVALSGHGGLVISAVFSPSGGRIVTASFDKTARVWDAATGAQLLVLSGHADHLNSANWSPDGRRIVTASDDKTARVWDADTGAQLVVLSGHEEGVNRASFSSDGQRIVTASDDRTIRVWDSVTGTQLSELRGHSDAVESAVYSPDGTRIVSASDDKTARIWNAGTGAQIAVLSGHLAGVVSAEFSPDGRRVVTASGDKTARIWDAATGFLRATLSGHTAYVMRAAYSPDGKRIVTASADRTIRIWDAGTGSQLASVSGHNDQVFSAVYSPDGTRILSASGDRTARVWDASHEPELKVLSGHSDFLHSAAWSTDGTRIVSASEDKTVRIWDATNGTQLAVLSRRDNVFNSASYSPDGRRILAATDHNAAVIWDAVTGKQLMLFSGHTDIVISAAYSSDGRHIVTASADKTARIWNSATGTQLAVLSGHNGIVKAAAFSPDGTRIVTASADNTARIWDAGTGVQLTILSGHVGLVSSAAFSPEGRRVVTASQDKTARVWDSASGEQLVVLSGHSGGVTSAKFSPDGRRIVTASWDKTVRVWDAATGAQLAVLSGHDAPLSSAVYSPDGDRIVTASDDWTARIWDAQIPAGLDAQIVWTKAAQFDPLSAVEREQLGLQRDAHIRVWPANSSKCDSMAAAPYDPDRLASGAVLTEISADLAYTACTQEISKSGDKTRLTYEVGRTLLARHDLAGAIREFRRAASQGYRSAQIDLANLQVNPAGGMLDSKRAISLYEEAWQDGVLIAAFELGRLYDHEVQPTRAIAPVDLSPDLAKAWLWYRKGADAGEPNALARLGERDDEAAVAAGSAAKRDALLLDAFRYYAAAAERAKDEDWPDDAWKNWRYRRASLARLLARNGMMQQVADAYTAVRDKWRPRSPTLRDRIEVWLRL